MKPTPLIGMIRFVILGIYLSFTGTCFMFSQSLSAADAVQDQRLVTLSRDIEALNAKLVTLDARLLGLEQHSNSIWWLATGFGGCLTLLQAMQLIIPYRKSKAKGAD